MYIVHLLLIMLLYSILNCFAPLRCTRSCRGNNKKKEAVEVVEEPKNSTLFVDHILSEVYALGSPEFKSSTMLCK